MSTLCPGSFFRNSFPTEISEDIYPICTGDYPIPVINQYIVHFFEILEGALVEAEDICVPEMCICDIENL